MTLIVSTITSSGIVLSADSRQTYRNNAGMTRIGSDSAMKLFQLNDRVGVSISGRAFLFDASGVLKNTGWYIEDFRINKLENTWTVKRIAEELNQYLASFFVVTETNNLRNQISTEVQKLGGTNLVFDSPQGHLIPYSFEKDGNKVSQTGFIDTINFIVAGIDNDRVGRSYFVSIPDGITIERNTLTCGAMWGGQTDVLVRIVLGRAPEIYNLNFAQQVTSSGVNIQAELNMLEYIINWGTMTLQDAIDFCALVTKTTESIQRFSDGTFLNPGGITGVGGEVDIALITPEKGFVWIKKKNLHCEDVVLDIEKEPNLIFKVQEKSES